MADYTKRDLDSILAFLKTGPKFFADIANHLHITKKVLNACLRVLSEDQAVEVYEKNARMWSLKRSADIHEIERHLLRILNKNSGHRFNELIQKVPAARGMGIVQTPRLQLALQYLKDENKIEFDASRGGWLLK